METLGTTEFVIRLAVATIAGMAIGLEREWREKAAGFRTLALVSLGGAVFVLAAVEVGSDAAARMTAGIATGVGFLGAGAILRERGEVVGLTTAAAVWIAAALGVSAATGAYMLTAAATVGSLIVLWVLSLVDLDAIRRETRIYEITYATPTADENAAARLLEDAGLRIELSCMTMSDAGLRADWRAVGRHERHLEAADKLRQDPGVVAFTVRG